MIVCCMARSSLSRFGATWKFRRLASSSLRSLSSSLDAKNTTDYKSARIGSVGTSRRTTHRTSRDLSSVARTVSSTAMKSPCSRASWRRLRIAWIRLASGMPLPEKKTEIQKFDDRAYYFHRCRVLPMRSFTVGLASSSSSSVKSMSEPTPGLIGRAPLLGGAARTCE